MKTKSVSEFVCAAPFAALAGIVPGKEVPLVRSEDSKPVFLVSTKGKWSTFSDAEWRRKEQVVRLSFPAKTSGTDGLAVIAYEIVRRKQ